MIIRLLTQTKQFCTVSAPNVVAVISHFLVSLIARHLQILKKIIRLRTVVKKTSAEWKTGEKIRRSASLLNIILQ